jgi:hypothetical protein
VVGVVVVGGGGSRATAAVVDVENQSRSIGSSCARRSNQSICNVACVVFCWSVDECLFV